MQRYEYTQPIKLVPRQFDELAVWCSDGLFQDAFRETVHSGLGIDNPDVITIPGPSKAIASGYIIPSIELLQQKHGVRQLHILDHIDCGVFGGLEAFDGSETAEAQAHYRNLKLAKEVIHHAIPDLGVKGYLLGTTHAENVALQDYEVAPKHLRQGL